MPDLESASTKTATATQWMLFGKVLLVWKVSVLGWLLRNQLFGYFTNSLALIYLFTSARYLTILQLRSKKIMTQFLE
jgi:hypothetical protein